MADDNGASSGDANPGGSGAGSQAGQGGQGSGSPQQGSGTSAQQQQSGSEPSVEQLQRELTEARREAAKHRTDLKKIQDEKLTADEKVAARLKELEAKEAEWTKRERDATTRAAVTEAARKANALYPDQLHRLLDIETDDAGKPTNLETAIAKARKDYPALFGAGGSADGGAGRGTSGAANGNRTMNDFIRGR